MNSWHLGLLLLAVVVVLWVGSGFMVNSMSGEYDKPYFITYVNTGTFTVYLIPTILRYFGRHQKSESSSYEAADGPAQFSTRDTAILGAQFALVWFFANFFNNASYLYTTVASATIIGCTSSFFTLLFGVFCKIETFNMAKLAALVVSIAGVTLITLADNNDETAPSNALLGNVYALAGAILYGVYTTLLKYRVGDESQLDTKLFFGCVGVSNVVLLAPVMVLIHAVGAERFELPQSAHIWWMLCLNAATTIVSDFLWIVAMLMTSPLVVTVGLSGTIPLSMLGDLIFRHRLGSLLYIVGAVMVCWSFFSINKQEQEDPAVVHASEPEPIGTEDREQTQV